MFWFPEILQTRNVSQKQAFYFWMKGKNRPGNL